MLCVRLSAGRVIMSSIPSSPGASRISLWANPIPLECGVVAPIVTAVPKSTSLSLHVRSIAAGVAGNFDFTRPSLGTHNVDAKETVEVCEEQRKARLPNVEVNFSL